MSPPRKETGLVISGSNFSKDLLPLINLRNAKIEVVYNYQFQKEGRTYTKKKSFELVLGNGVSFNQFTVSGDRATPSSDALYLKGGQGYVAELTIPESDATFQKLKAKKAIINQADLFLYVDKDKVNIAQQPAYILVYNATKGTALPDYAAELSIYASSKDIVSIGRLQKDSRGDYFYHLYMTDHLTQLIKNGAENVKIGLATSSHLLYDTRSSFSAMRSIYYKNAANEVKKTVLGTAENILYTVIHGNSPQVPQAKKLKLMVYYTPTTE